MDKRTTFIGLDVHKTTIAVAIADADRHSEVRSFGVIANEARALDQLVRRVARSGRKLRFCYEAGPCGYAVYRQLADAGHDCIGCGVLSLRHFRLASWCSLSLGGWWPRFRRGASRPARAAWSVQRLVAARW
jgi:hypothetical protein